MCVILSTTFAFSQQLVVEIEGEGTFNTAMLSIDEAGDDFPSDIEAENPFYVSVFHADSWDKKVNPSDRWNIKIYKSDSNWDNELQLETKRTGNGYNSNGGGNPNIHDGEIYQTVTNTPVYFFRGQSEITDIPVLLKLSGFSLSMGAETYDTNIIFTVYDSW